VSTPILVGLGAWLVWQTPPPLTLSPQIQGRALGISVHTAKFHVGALIDKFDAVGRTDAVAQAARRGVIHL
jgi:hypothetical protein